MAVFLSPPTNSYVGFSVYGVQLHQLTPCSRSVAAVLDGDTGTWLDGQQDAAGCGNSYGGLDHIRRCFLGWTEMGARVLGREWLG
jgi:hypothetical protein